MTAQEPIEARTFDAGVPGRLGDALFHFRDQQGLEVDFLIPGKQGSVTLVEVKATCTVKPAMAEPVLRLGAAWKGRSGSGSLRQVVIHRESRAPVASHALAPDVQALSLLDFVAATSGLSAST